MFGRNEAFLQCGFSSAIWDFLFEWILCYILHICGLSLHVSSNGCLENSFPWTVFHTNIEKVFRHYESWDVVAYNLFVWKIWDTSHIWMALFRNELFHVFFELACLWMLLSKRNTWRPFLPLRPSLLERWNQTELFWGLFLVFQSAKIENNQFLCTLFRKSKRNSARLSVLFSNCNS